VFFWVSFLFVHKQLAAGRVGRLRRGRRIADEGVESRRAEGGVAPRLQTDISSNGLVIRLFLLLLLLLFLRYQVIGHMQMSWRFHRRQIGQQLRQDVLDALPFVQLEGVNRRIGRRMSRIIIMGVFSAEAIDLAQIQRFLIARTFDGERSFRRWSLRFGAQQGLDT